GELQRQAEALTERRRKGAAELTAAVEGELRALGMKAASFQVRLVSVRVETPEGFELPSGPRGRERAEFWLAPNPGEESRRLRDAASGGERARVVLALRTALRGAGPGQTLLFDEVDVGIGGGTARRVGERLRRLSQDHQVVCITHLPQIAALGDTHARIVKRVRRGRTHTLVERLDGEGRVTEIARIAGGGKITPATRAHARDLLGV
ncbi:MAG: DNA repair protein RecN, partial [Myxococcota bacterium]